MKKLLIILAFLFCGNAIAQNGRLVPIWQGHSYLKDTIISGTHYLLIKSDTVIRIDSYLSLPNVVNMTSLNNILSGNGANITGLNATNISTGTLNNLRLNSGVATDTSLLVKRITSTHQGVPRFTGTTGVLQSSLMSITDSGRVTISSTSTAINPQLTVQRNGTGGTGLQIANTTTTGYTAFWLYTGAVSSVCYGFGSTYSSSGRFIAGSLLFDNDGAGGLTFNAQNSTAIVRFMTGANLRMKIDSSGNIGMGGINAVTAKLHLSAGSTTIPPLRFNSGSLTTTATAGQFEFLTDRLYFTQTTNDIRKEIPLMESTRLTSDFSKSNSTLANVTGLTATLGAGKSYRFTARLDVDCGGTGGIKFALSGTATATAIRYTITATEPTPLLVLSSRQTALNGSAGTTGFTTAYVTIEGFITCNATGTLTVQFAQQTTDGTPSTVLSGSNFVVENIQ